MPPGVEALIGLAVLGIGIGFAVRRWRRQYREWRARPKLVEAPPRGPLDLLALFEAGRQFGEAQIRIEPVGVLHVSSGRIVACDPLVFPESPPFDTKVLAGDYPVDVAVAQFPEQQRVAAVRVTFRPGAPTRFEPAGRYGVDAGVGCFMDEQTAPLLPEDDYYDRVLAPELEKRDWVDYRPVADRPDNVVIVHAGWGDGFYTTYWGFDDTDVPLWLVTDFRVV